MTSDGTSDDTSEDPPYYPNPPHLLLLSVTQRPLPLPLPLTHHITASDIPLASLPAYLNLANHKISSHQAETESAQREPPFYATAIAPSVTSNTGPLPSLNQSGLSTAPIAVSSSSESSDASRPSNVSGSTSGPLAPIFPPTPAYNPGGSRFRLDRQLINSAVPRLFSTEAILMEEIDFTAPRACKFMDDCNITKGMDRDTINWRKSMSHIFGRNKNCTRSIPEPVWMWVCRKHYQRARYRNDHDYSIKINQVVEVQILRLEAWSNYNRDMGQPQNGIVVDWSLVVRRRQQMLLDEEQGRKRKASGDSADEDDEDDDDDSGDPGSPAAPDPGAVPGWLLSEVGTGKTTAEIQSVVARIHNELQHHRLSHFPDIELLPNITGDRAKPKQNRARPGNGPAAKKAGASARNIQQNKRQRMNDEDRRAEPASQGGRYPFAPNPYAPPPPPSGAANPLGHLNAPYPPHMPWQNQYPGSHGSHNRSSSAGANPFQSSAPAGPGYHTLPSRYGGYHQDPAYGGGHNEYLAAQTAEPQSDNGYWTPGYHDRQQRMLERQQQQQPEYGQQGGYYRAFGGPQQGSQQGMPQSSAAKHSRNLSTPARTSPAVGMGMGMGSGFERPQDPMRAPAPRSDNMYGTPGQYQNLFVPSAAAPGPSADNIPRIANANASTTQLPIRSGRPSPPAGPTLPNPGPLLSGHLPPPPEGYEAYEGYHNLPPRR